MKWTAEYVDMIEKADIKIDDKYVLWVKNHGKVGSRALETLTQAVSKKVRKPVTYLAVWQKIFRLRNRKSQKKAKQDTPERHVEQDTRKLSQMHSRPPSPEMPTLSHRLLQGKRSRSPTPPPPQQQQMPLPSIQVLPQPPPPQASAEDDNGISQYEKDRLATIARNNAIMSALGIGMPSATLPVVKRPYNKKPKVRKADRGCPRASERNCGLRVDYTEVPENFDDGDKSRK